jgi:hypothetical protein
LKLEPDIFLQKFWIPRGYEATKACKPRSPYLQQFILLSASNLKAVGHKIQTPNEER